MMNYTKFILLCTIIGIMSACTPSSTNNTAKSSTSDSSWSAIQTRRDKAQTNYINNKRVDYDWFANFASAYAGVPFILQRTFPELAPDIWGPPEEHFAKFGLFHDPNDLNRPLPRGLGWTTVDRKPANQYNPKKPSMHVVTLTCGACHIGKVRVSDGNYKDLIGAPNTQMDTRLWRRAFELTVDKFMQNDAQIEKTADRIIQIIKEKPDTYFYKGYRNFSAEAELSQRAMFTNKNILVKILQGFAAKVGIGRVTVLKQMHTSYAKNGPPLDGGSPGLSDGSGDLIPKLLMLEHIGDKTDPAEVAKAVQSFSSTDFAALPKDLATVTDILSTWQQADKPLAQIDGSVKSPYFRNIAAIVAIAGDPKYINYVDAEFTARFIHQLPPPAYPFPVDMASANRGAKLFEDNCRGCHHTGNKTLYPDLGVDFNRAQVLNKAGFDLFVRNFVAGVPKGYSFVDAEGNTVEPASLSVDEILIARTSPDNQGYITNALEGLWARAPYLHNGSIPTLRHLLAPDNPESRRPSKFVRGAISYDQKNVGYVWDLNKIADYRKQDQTVAIYNSTQDGLSNTGHDADVRVGEKFFKLNWSGPENKQGLEDLLEYLKTL